VKLHYDSIASVYDRRYRDKAGGDQQEQRERNLREDERLAGARLSATRNAPGFVLQRRRSSGCVER
jgi:hypothetical protein